MCAPRQVLDLFVIDLPNDRPRSLAIAFVVWSEAFPAGLEEVW